MADFDTLYTSFSNKDLLKITDRPEWYQPLAVAAATRILATRTVDETDHTIAAAELQEELWRQNREKEFVSKAGNRIASTFHYLFSPTERFDVQRWVYLISIALGLQYLLEAVDSIQYLRFFFRCASCSLTAIEWMLAFSLVFPIVLVILLFRHRLLGWKLAVFNSGLVILIKACFTVMQSRHFGLDLIYPLLTIALHVGLLKMLYRGDVQNFFGVTKKDFEKALVWAAITGAVTVLAVAYTT